jgi:multidrug transporter EmrE-like cation transporter
MAIPTGGAAERDDTPPRPPRVAEVGGQLAIETKREDTRSWIAKTLVLLLIAMSAAMVALIAAHDIKVNEALAMLGALTAVVGTALGFYFGGHKGG